MFMVQLLREHGVPYLTEEDGDHHCSRGWLQVDCPLCSPRCNLFRLGFHLQRRFLNCWVCGKLPLVDTLTQILSLPFKEVKEIVGGLESSRPVVTNVRGKLELPTGLGALLPVHKEYLKGRDFDPEELVKLWSISSTGRDSTIPWRVFIPLTLNGEVVSWTARTIGRSSLKYISAELEKESYPHKHLLYGEEKAKHAIVIVEGPFDAWRVGPGGVATLGVGTKRAQLLRMTRFPVRVVVFDSEEAAQKRADKLCDQLEAFPGKTYRVTLDAADPGSAEKREIKRLRRRFLS